MECQNFIQSKSNKNLNDNILNQSYFIYLKAIINAVNYIIAINIKISLY